MGIFEVQYPISISCNTRYNFYTWMFFFRKPSLGCFGIGVEDSI